jgi:hypothetical protein
MLTVNSSIATNALLNLLSPIHQASAYEHSNYQTDSKAHTGPTNKNPINSKAIIAALNDSQNSLQASGFSDVSRLA